MRTNPPDRPPGLDPALAPPFPRPGRGRAVSDDDRRALRHARSVVLGFGVPHRDVDDLVQDVMFAVARSAHLFTVPDGRTEAAARSAWLWKIAARCVARHRWRQALESRVQLSPHVPSGDWLGPRAAPSPELLLAKRELYTRLSEGLESLHQAAPEQHEVLIAHVLGEVPMPRIAGAQGVRVHVAWNRYHLGKQALSAHLRGRPRACGSLPSPAGRGHGREGIKTGREGEER